MCTRIWNSICCTVYYQRWSHCAILGADYDEGHVYKIDPAIANTQWLTDRPFDLTSCQTAHYLRRVTGGWLLHLMSCWRHPAWSEQCGTIWTTVQSSHQAASTEQCHWAAACSHKHSAELQDKTKPRRRLPSQWVVPRQCTRQECWLYQTQIWANFQFRLRLCKNPSHTPRVVFDQALKLDTYMVS